MNLEINILNVVNQKEKDKPYNITFIWNLKYDTNQHIYETETYSQTQRTDLWLPSWEVGEG